MQRTIVAFSLSLVIITVAICLRTPTTQAQDSSELWRVRSQAFTDDLLKDAGQLAPFRRAVLLARLGQHWWAEDPARARTWFRSASEIVEQVPNKENADERRERIATARILLKTVARIDKKLTESLVKIVTPDAQCTEQERTESAEWLMNSATDLIAVDTKRASELAAVALRAGPPNNVDTFLFTMRRHDPKLADTMFVQALSVAKQQSFPVQILHSLTFAAFPEKRGYTTIAVPPDSLRIQLLQLDIDFLNGNPINGDNRGPICSGVGSFIAPLLSEFDRLVPTQAGVVRQAINKCESLSPLLQQQLDDGSREQPYNSSAEFLKAAADAKDVKVRTVYQFRAANLAKEAKDYDLAFRILDGMEKEQREFMGEAWDSFRWDWASQGALDYYRQGRLAEMNAILNAVPADLQPFGKIAFLSRLREPKDAEPAPIVQILNDALIGLRRSTVSDSDKHNWFFSLLRLTVKYQPAEARAVLKEAVSSLNKTKDQKTLDTTELTEGVAEPLLQMDEYIVKDSVASITSVESRAQLRLVLLEAALRNLKSYRSK